MALNRSTRQRRLIGEEAAKFESFFTAEELFERVRERDPRLGIATVYRYLRDTGCSGDVHAYYCDRRMVFSMNDHSHCHFHCVECGTVSHVGVEKIDFMRKVVKGRMCHFQIDVYGICEGCLSKRDGAKRDVRA